MSTNVQAEQMGEEERRSLPLTPLKASGSSRTDL